MLVNLEILYWITDVSSLSSLFASIEVIIIFLLPLISKSPPPKKMFTLFCTLVHSLYFQNLMKFVTEETKEQRPSSLCSWSQNALHLFMHHTIHLLCLTCMRLSSSPIICVNYEETWASIISYICTLLLLVLVGSLFSKSGISWSMSVDTFDLLFMLLRKR